MGLDATLKRFSPAIIAAMLMIIAYFQAVGMGQLLAAAVAGGDVPRHVSRPRSSPTERDHDHQTSALAILERNPFDSVTGPLHEGPPKPLEGGDGSSLLGHDPYADPPCTGARALLIASSKDPEWSFAIIVGTDGKSVLRRKDEEIDGQKVFFVGDLRPDEHQHEGEAGLWDRVWLTSGATRCQLALGAKPIGMKAPPPQAQAQSGTTSTLGGKIRQISDHEFEIDRSAVEATIANPAELMKARIFPVRDGDRVVGMKLLGIRQGMVLGQLGLQNGDVLTAINGFEMNDPQRMLEAYSKLMSASRVTATVLRGGRPMNIDFNIK